MRERSQAATGREVQAWVELGVSWQPRGKGLKRLGGPPDQQKPSASRGETGSALAPGCVHTRDTDEPNGVLRRGSSWHRARLDGALSGMLGRRLGGDGKAGLSRASAGLARRRARRPGGGKEGFAWAEGKVEATRKGPEVRRRVTVLWSWW